MRPSTQLIHAGGLESGGWGGANTPIYQSATFSRSDADDYMSLRYIRLNNTPNHEVLSRRLAGLEGAEDAVVTGSGMAAIANALQSLTSSGDRLISMRGVYGGSYDFLVSDLARMGVGVDFVGANSPEEWRACVTPDTRVFYVESLSNPLLEVPDLEGIVAFCREHDLVSVIDNTFLTPLYYRPLDAGFDLVVHSATKYLNGHSDIVAGVVAGSAARLAVVRKVLCHTGGSLDPHACFLLERGMKTLAVRLDYQSRTTDRLASWLRGHPSVRKVYWPGFDNHPQFERAGRLFGGLGAVVSFEPDGDAEMAQRVVDALQLPLNAPSLGGVETLVSRPAKSSHAGMRPEDRAKSGIRDELIRLAIGLEHYEDLRDDLEQALKD